MAFCASSASFLAFSSFYLATFSKMILEIVFSLVDFEPAFWVAAVAMKLEGVKL